MALIVGDKAPQEINVSFSEGCLPRSLCSSPILLLDDFYSQFFDNKARHYEGLMENNMSHICRMLPSCFKTQIILRYGLQ